jgi:hypothetical protein
MRTRFCIMLFDIRKKSIERSKMLENTKKVGICSNIRLFCTKIEAKFKKRSLMAPAVFDALSNKKKYLTLYRTVVECRCKYGKPPHEKDMCSKIVISLAKYKEWS